jgi:hypothetical protein
VTTDRTGHFSIEDVPAGSYAVNAWREGYFGRGTDPETSGMYDGAAMFDMVFVNVEPGRTATSVLELIPGAVIDGRVTGPQGMPLVDQDVRAFRAHRQGEETVLRGVTKTATDDRGQYRLHTLPPGEYFIASGMGFPEMGDPDPEKIAHKPTPGEQVPILTFHPSTISPESALSIVLTGGEDVENKDIAVRTARVIRISGHVIDVSGFPDVSSASVQLLPRERKWRVYHGGVLGGDVDGNGVLAGTSALFTDPNRGRFEFRGTFQPGAYEVRATVSTQDRRKAVGSTVIDVRSEDVEGIRIIVNAEAAGPPGR